MHKASASSSPIALYLSLTAGNGVLRPVVKSNWSDLPINGKSCRKSQSLGSQRLILHLPLCSPKHLLKGNCPGRDRGSLNLPFASWPGVLGLLSVTMATQIPERTDRYSWRDTRLSSLHPAVSASSPPLEGQGHRAELLPFTNLDGSFSGFPGTFSGQMTPAFS